MIEASVVVAGVVEAFMITVVSSCAVEVVKFSVVKVVNVVEVVMAGLVGLVNAMKSSASMTCVVERLGIVQFPT